MGERLVGIVTINDDTNYGNRLQNFALHEVVRSLDREPETIVNRPPSWSRSLLVPRAMHDLGHDLPGVIARARSRLPHGFRRPAAPALPFLEVRRAAIAGFARNRIRSSPHAYSAMPTDYWADRYEHAVAGSDQVWNPTYRRAQPIDFLEFIDGPRRIAYAPSFGVRRIPGFLRSRYREWIEGITHLSVREHGGADIVADLTGRAAPVVLDPTALLPRTEWDALIEDRSRPVDGTYAVRYFLGRPTAAQDEWMTHDAARRRLEVVDLHALDQERFADVDPLGFVAAIARADAVYTDSFHAATFSLLYRRPLVLGRRYASDVRQEELLAQHGLLAGGTGVDGLRVVADVDWSEVDARRERLRASSMAFLTAALDGSVGAPG
ncbi:polysaccharide pyruvyl transferase family protein [Agromyces sp. GXQ0307]|uniref:polysaccharide pyruvyl transferase family protein n=1 Tax=Agromyces sp. GXQ0307 TaxID=3377835 RepID=UPI003839ECD7